MLDDVWKTWLAVAAAVLCGVLIWFAGPLFGLRGTDLRVTQSAIGVLGVSGIGTFLWTRWRTRPQTTHSDAGSSTPSSGGEIKRLLADADQRLAGLSRNRWTHLRQMPVLLILRASEGGPASIVGSSELRTDELCGAEFPPTPLRAFLHESAVLLEVGRAALQDPESWKQIVRHLYRPGLRTLLGLERVGPRTVVACFGLEGPTASSASQQFADRLAGEAQTIRNRLDILSGHAASQTQVGVLFTGLENVAYGADYLRHASGPEAAELLGVRFTGPEDTPATQATKAFYDIYYRLCGRRVEIMSDEAAVARRWNLYEFPREFLKIRPAISGALARIAPPAFEGARHKVAGFGFSGSRRSTGVRERSVSAGAGESPVPGGATVVLSPHMQPTFVMTSGDEHIFVAPFLHHLALPLLREASPAQGPAGLRQLWLLAAAGVAAVLIGAFIADSGLRNQQMIGEVRGNIHGGSPDGLLAVFKKLKEQDHGWALGRGHWGLYAGDSLYERARIAWIQRFRREMLEPLARQLEGELTQPDRVQGGAPEAYNALRALLVMTSENPRMTSAYLTPVAVRRLGDNARQHFDLYISEFRNEPALLLQQTPATDDAVRVSREYLTNRLFNAKNIYDDLSAQAVSLPSVQWSGPVIHDTVTVPGRFSAAGRKHIESAFTRVDGPWGKEPWVLKATAPDRAQLQAEVLRLWAEQAQKPWLDFLAGASVPRFGDSRQAARSLAELGGPPSATEQFACLITTPVGTDPAFKSVSTAVPSCETRSEAMGVYLTKLASLQGVLQTLDQLPPAERTRPCLDAADRAREAADSAARSTGAAAEKYFAKLLRDPVDHAREACGCGAASEINTAAAGVCDAFSAMKRKYPFNLSAKAEVTPQELEDLFKADGRIAELAAKASGASVPLSQSFLQSLDRLQRIGALLRTSDLKDQGAAVLRLEDPRRTHMTVVVRTDAVPDWASNLRITLGRQTVSHSVGAQTRLWLPFAASTASEVSLSGSTARFDGYWSALRALRLTDPRIVNNRFVEDYRQGLLGTSISGQKSFRVEVDMGPAYQAIAETSCISKAGR